MNQNLTLIKALVATLQLEVESLGKPTSATFAEGPITLIEEVRDYESNLIKAALLRTGGNQRMAAQMLGVKTSTLNTKIKHNGIEFIKHPMPEPVS